MSHCCFNVGPASQTMGQHYNNSGTTPRVCWATCRLQCTLSIAILTLWTRCTDIFVSSYTVDLVILACLNFREFMILGLFTKFRIREFLFFFSSRQTDRYFIDRNKSHYRLICHSNKRDIYTCIYKNVSLLKSYDNIHGMSNN